MLDEEAQKVMRESGAQPLFSGYVQGSSPPFPAATCISVNDEVVHGIPGSRALHPGDVVTIDVGVRFEGWCADSAISLVVPAGEGEFADLRTESEVQNARRMVLANRALLNLAIGLMRPGVMWSRIAKALEVAAEASGFGIVTEYIGHGIGRQLHELPRAPAYWTGFRGEDFCLEEGMTLAVEPMLTSRRGGPADVAGAMPGMGVGADGLPVWRTQIRDGGDGWTVLTRDGSFACHEEHVVAIVPGGSRVLTADPTGIDAIEDHATGPEAQRWL